MTIKRFQSELMRCTNNETGKVTYYVSKCDVFSRISKEDYNKRYDEADEFLCVYQRTTGKFTRRYITAIYEYDMKDKAQ